MAVGQPKLGAQNSPPIYANDESDESVDYLNLQAPLHCYAVSESKWRDRGNRVQRHQSCRTHM